MWRQFSCFALVVALLLLSSSSVTAAELPPQDLDFFEKQVRPLLVKRCFECHGGAKSGGGLSLGSAAGSQKGGDSGPAIVPGKPEQSLLIAAINYRSLEMPPADHGGKLPDDEITVLTKWVAMGAPDPRTGGDVIGGMTREEAKSQWSFQPLPLAGAALDPKSGARHIDGLLQREMDRHGLSVAPPADRRTLIRRITYDLTGLPPTPTDVEAFLADPSPEAVAKLIDRLLDSPQYGVQWGRHWLDVVRYADTAGENTDRPLPHSWRYRNWVIDAFNRDLPFDQFVRMQIAGDVMRQNQDFPQRAEGIIATGYLAIARRFGHDIDKDLYLTHEDVIDNLGKNFLGLTLGCARCHDHKYDPISSEDYYALYGIFESTRFAFPGCEPKGQPRDLVPLIDPAQADALQAAYGHKLAEYEELIGAEQRPQPPEPPAIPVAYAVAEGKPKNARFQDRGDPEKPGAEVPRRWLSVFGGAEISAGSGSGRWDLSEWVAAHPLTARVMANRIWEWHFGRGLVSSSNDFGARGERPTHPELLDWLAAQFVQNGYSVKVMHQLILQTAAYQRASAAPATADPDNRWLAHFRRRRLTAEEIRDSLLAASGQLDLTPGEAHPFPPENTWNFTQHAPFNAVYETNRRSAYLMVQRQRRHPFLAIFDGADPNASTPARQTTTVPTQALYFVNDPFFHAQAAAFTRFLLSLPDDEARLVQTYRTLFQRDPTEGQRARTQRFVDSYPAEPAEKWSALVRVLMASNEFLHVE
jgi:hypothetical protein